jgi:hypothetical protein
MSAEHYADVDLTDPLDQHKAKGAVVVELSRWGITDRPWTRASRCCS